MSTQEKDKTRPKGAMSAYAYFVQVIREEHKRKHPGDQVVFSEFSKKCAEKWKLMTPKEKKRFEEMSSNDKDRYNKEMNNYQPQTDGGRKRRKKRRIKEPGQPKRAWSAFFFFCDEFRPKIREIHPDWRVGNIAKELGRQWESCSDKLKYEKQSEADKQRYEEQMSQYRAGQYVPPLKRTRADANNGTAVAGSSSTEDTAAVVNDASIIEDEDIEDEEEFDDGGESENGADKSSSILKHNSELSDKNGKDTPENHLQEPIADSTSTKLLETDSLKNDAVDEGSSNL